MSITEMSLPIDIPWKRLGVSKDMIDSTGGDLRFPEKWRSSIAVFYHEPTEVLPDYCDRKITYIKVVATITNYQWDDVSALKDLASRYSEYGPAHSTKNVFDATLTRSYPCYGALLQVGVYPNPPAGVELHDYPYFSSFQPRKREMYEVLTQSGEVTSQSGNKLNILKGTTNTDTTEDYDLDMGGGGGGHSGIFGLWSEQHTGENKQVGTINRSQTENQNVTNMDASREKRESHAFSTNINQLYTLLQGYHLGTNRSMFFMQPRPHMQDQKFTFIRGLRRLEGIQEFFFIVDRPASVPGICIEVALETAHAHLRRDYEPRLIPQSELYAPGNLSKTAKALGIDVKKNPSYSYWQDLVDKWWASSFSDRIYAATWPQLPAELVGQPFPNNFVELTIVVARLPEIGLEDVALIFEEYESDKGTFFVTARRLCACVKPVPLDQDEADSINCEHSTEDNISTCDNGPSVVYWEGYEGRAELLKKSIEKATKGLDLNTMVQDINNTLWSSIGSTSRLGYGEISFMETDFMLDELAQVVRLLKGAGIRDQPLEEVESMRPLLSQGLGQYSEVRTVLDVAALSTKALARDLNTNEMQARKIHAELLVESLRALDPQTLEYGVVLENPIQERFNHEFPEEKLRELEGSAGVRPKEASEQNQCRQKSPRCECIIACIRKLAWRFPWRFG